MSMPTSTSTIDAQFRTLSITKHIDIEASPQIAFEALLDQLGPASEMPGGEPFPMKIEPWPGGRWFRDLGNNSGHLWAHVQVIKPPALLELIGPLFMSYPAISHVQYRLTPIASGVRMTIMHRAMGLIIDDHLVGVHEGWQHELELIRTNAHRRAGRTT
jgi:hypothetical protein